MKRFLTALLLVTTVLGSAAPSFAADATPGDIISALKERGITTYLDADRCQQLPVAGFYVGQARALVLCNNGSREACLLYTSPSPRDS